MEVQVIRIGMWALLLTAVGTLVGSSALAEGSEPSAAARPSSQRESAEQYPYDPVCPWGRLADGRGMLLRCLQPAEASALLTKDAATPIPTPSSRPPAPDAVKAAPPQKLAVLRIGPAQADVGELPLADKKLVAANPKFVECVANNGGLSADPARVVLRFLVRERGRAEGVTVKSATGMSQKAAECIANVVDRRYVGYPAAPLVGATLPIELSANH